MSTRRIALIDGDEIVYKIGYLTQDTYHTIQKPDTDKFYFNYKEEAIEWIENDESDWEFDIHVDPKPVQVTRYQFARILAKIMKATRATEYRIFLNGEDNFRDSIATIIPYKGNRDNSRRPHHFQSLKDYMVKEHDAKYIERAEADDGCSMAQYYYRARGIESIIVSQDKDLRMVPGEYYNLPKDQLGVVEPDDGLKWFYKQILMGDPTDNIPGIYRVGPKAADKIIDPLPADPSVLWNTVLETYEEALKDPKKRDKMPAPDMPVRDRVIEVARLLWMQEDKDQLWRPPDEAE